MKTTLRDMFDSLPGPARRIARALRHAGGRFPLTQSARRNQWIREVYTQFGWEQTRNLFLSIARFCQINRPIHGYYLEFGCHEANTMRLAYDTFHRLFDWTYVAFDSFEGLPEIAEIDRQEIWQKGKLKTDERTFVDKVTRHGMPREKLITIKGFYNTSLTESLKSELLPTKAAVIYIDCDLYESAVPVLNFIKDFLQRGTVVVFDDWNCFYGDPNRGERRAFKEFRQREPALLFEDFVQTDIAKSFIFIGDDKS